MKNNFWIQPIKYGIVGVINTLVCFIVIWAILRFAFGITGAQKATGIEITVANVSGYVVGLLTSFLLNRKWTFQSEKNWKPEFVKFITGVLICYIPQLIVVNLLNKSLWIHSLSVDAIGLNSSLICNVIGMVFYTVLNFIYNKYYTFRK